MWGGVRKGVQVAPSRAKEGRQGRAGVRSSGGGVSIGNSLSGGGGIVGELK